MDPQHIVDKLAKIESVQLPKKASYLNILRKFTHGTKISSAEYWISTYLTLVRLYSYPCLILLVARGRRAHCTSSEPV